MTPTPLSPFLCLSLTGVVQGGLVSWQHLLYLVKTIFLGVRGEGIRSDFRVLMSCWSVAAVERLVWAIPQRLLL